MLETVDKRELIKDWVLGVVLFVTALALRIPYLWIIPRHIDELKEVKLAFDIFKGVSLPLHNAAWDIGAMHNYILSIIFWLFGPNINAPRLYVAVISALTVAVVYYLGKKMFGFWVGVLSAGLLLTNGMHIMVSHMAWANCTTPFFFVLSMLALLAAERRRDGRWLIASAFLWALTLQTHSSVVIYILVAFIYATGPNFREAIGSIKWYYGAVVAFAVGYANMIYFNLIQEPFGSLFFLAKKSYALETKPGLVSYFENANQMLIELLRTISAT
ncbi:MAG: glycosyltransferase family 39 protein, partial [Candidatus Saccharibacteria bacterium]